MTSCRFSREETGTVGTEVTVVNTLALPMRTQARDKLEKVVLV